MRRLWFRIRIPLAVLALLLVTLVMVRLFSGPEDTWIRDESGAWVKHGHPAGPPPPPGYREPITHMIVPLSFLVAFVLPLVFIRRHKPHDRLNFDTANRDIKLLGYLSTALPLVGILIVLGLVLEMVLAGASGGNNAVPDVEELAVYGETLFFIVSLEGFAGLCILSGLLFLVLKRNCSDHYQLARRQREIMEVLESSGRK